jgi:hypothetical protein
MALSYWLLTVWAAEEVPVQMIHQKGLPHDITISPITLARGANQNVVPHDITVYPGQNIQSEATSSWQLSHSNFQRTLKGLRGSCLAGGHGRRDSNWVATWRNLALLCGEGMPQFLVSSKHERRIQVQLWTLSTAAAAFPFSISSFSCEIPGVVE